MTIFKELLDELLSGVERPEDLLGDKRLMRVLKVRLMERMLGAELTKHLGYVPYSEPAIQQSNRRNGSTRKVLKGNGLEFISGNLMAWAEMQVVQLEYVQLGNPQQNAILHQF